MRLLRTRGEYGERARRQAAPLRPRRRGLPAGRPKDQTRRKGRPSDGPASARRRTPSAASGDEGALCRRLRSGPAARLSSDTSRRRRRPGYHCRAADSDSTRELSRRPKGGRHCFRVTCLAAVTGRQPGRLLADRHGQSRRPMRLACRAWPAGCCAWPAPRTRHAPDGARPALQVPRWVRPGLARLGSAQPTGPGPVAPWAGPSSLLCQRPV